MEPDIVLLFINSGINISSVNEDNSTILHYVIEKDIECTKFILEHGIDTTIRNIYGETAYTNALNNNYVAIAELIREYEEISLIKGTS
jgi:ankyrin repeat protein